MMYRPLGLGDFADRPLAANVEKWLDAALALPAASGMCPFPYVVHHRAMRIPLPDSHCTPKRQPGPILFVGAGIRARDPRAHTATSPLIVKLAIGTPLGGHALWGAIGQASSQASDDPASKIARCQESYDEQAARQAVAGGVELVCVGRNAVVELGERQLYAQLLGTLANRERVPLLATTATAPPERWATNWAADWTDADVELQPFSVCWQC